LKNEASRRICLHAGFLQERVVAARVLSPLRFNRAARAVKWKQPNARDDARVAAALNKRYAEHQLWRPVDGVNAADDSSQSSGPAQPLLFGVEPDSGAMVAGRLLAAHRLAALEVSGFRLLPDSVNRFLRPLFALSRLRLVWLRQPLLPDHCPAAVRALLSRAQEVAGMGAIVVVVLDRKDPAWPVVARYPGITLNVHILSRCSEPIGQDRPWFLD
jgi:hypothetical protein